MTEGKRRTWRPIDDVLRRVVLIFRILSLLWMGGLVAATLISDEGADPVWVWAAMGTAVAMTMGTWVAARSRERLGSWWWVTLDGVGAFFVGISPGIAGAADLFYGGIPLSWLLLVVYATSRFALGCIAVGILTVTQLINARLYPDPLSPAQYFGRIAVWVVSALAYGWTMWALRESEKQRIEMEQERDVARVEQRLAAERAEIAARLHDSVLQTLALVQRDAGDEDAVRRLARNQELELRNLIDRMASPFEDSFRAAAKRMAAEVEEIHRTKVNTVVIGDCELEPRLGAALDAAREAAVNAARHSGAGESYFTCEVARDRVTLVVHDRGRGFDPAAVKSDGGLVGSVTQRVTRHGGEVEISSSPGKGTEVEIVMPIGTTDE